MTRDATDACNSLPYVRQFREICSRPRLHEQSTCPERALNQAPAGISKQIRSNAERITETRVRLMIEIIDTRTGHSNGQTLLHSLH